MTRTGILLCCAVLSACSALGLDQVGALPCDVEARDPTAEGHLCAELNAGRDAEHECMLYQCSSDGRGCVLAPQDLDRDGDPSAARCAALAGTDCDDGDPRVAMGAEEQCNQRDDDCDGQVDEDTAWRVEASRVVDGAEPGPGVTVTALADGRLAVVRAGNQGSSLLRIDSDGETQSELVAGPTRGPNCGGSRCAFNTLNLHETRDGIRYLVGIGTRGSAEQALLTGITSRQPGLLEARPFALGDGTVHERYTQSSMGTQLHVAYAQADTLHVARIEGAGEPVDDDFRAPLEAGAPFALGATDDRWVLAYGDSCPEGPRGVRLACADADEDRYRTGMYSGCGCIALAAGPSEAISVDGARALGAELLVAVRSGSVLGVAMIERGEVEPPLLELARDRVQGLPLVVRLGENAQGPRWVVLWSQRDADDVEPSSWAVEVHRGESGQLVQVAAPASLALVEQAPLRSAAFDPERERVDVLAGTTLAVLACGPRPL